MSGTLDYHLKHQDFKCQGACTLDADRLMIHNAVLGYQLSCSVQSFHKVNVISAVIYPM